MKPRRRPPTEHLSTRFLLRPALLMILFLLIQAMPASAQGGGVLLNVKSGFPSTLPADGESTTIIEVNVQDAPCWKGAVPWGSNFTILGKVSRGRLMPLNAVTQDFPFEITYVAGMEPGPATIQVDVTYCPDGAVSMFGVCVVQEAADTICTASIELMLETPAEEETPIEEQSDPEPAQAEVPEETTETEQSEPAPEASEAEAEEIAALAQDLDSFLSTATGEVDVRRVAAGSGAVGTLILIWVLMQRGQGVDEGQLMDSVRAWRDAVEAPSKPKPTSLPEFDNRPNNLPEMEAQPPPTPQSQPPRPAQEGIESRAHRAGEDLADGFQALRDTLDQGSALKKKLEDDVPPIVRESPVFKKAAGLFDAVIKKAEKISHVDQAKRVIDEFNQHTRMHRKVDRELDGRVSQEGRQSIKVLQSAIRGATEAPIRVSDTAHDTIAAAGEAALKPFSEEAAQSFRNAVDKEKKALHEVRNGVVEIPTKGAKVVTKGPFGEHWQEAEVNNPELRGIRGDGAFPKPETPDFGRGWRKAKRAYNAVGQWLGGIFR